MVLAVRYYDKTKKKIYKKSIKFFKILNTSGHGNIYILYHMINIVCVSGYVTIIAIIIII